MQLETFLQAPTLGGFCSATYAYVGLLVTTSGVKLNVEGANDAAEQNIYQILRELAFTLRGANNDLASSKVTQVLAKPNPWAF